MSTEPIAELLKEMVEVAAGHHISYSEKEAAERLGVGVRTMYNLRAEQKISFSLVAGHIRYTPADLDEYVTKNRHQAKR